MYTVKMLVKNGKKGLINPCGSDYTKYIHLKSLQGAISRIKKMPIRNNVVLLRLYDDSNNNTFEMWVKDFNLNIMEF